MTAQGFRGVDRIMVRHGDEIHATPLQRFIDFERIVVAFAANPAHHRDRAHSRMTGVNMAIAFHAPFYQCNVTTRQRLKKHLLHHLFVGNNGAP